MHDGAVEVVYPLSAADSVATAAGVIAVYLAPLLFTLTDAFPLVLLSAGIAVVSVSLYAVTYIGAVLASSLLVGWYLDAAGAVVYAAASAIDLWRRSRPVAVGAVAASAGGVLGLAQDSAAIAAGGALAGLLLGAAFARVGRTTPR